MNVIEPPPLPEFATLVDSSKWILGQPGLHAKAIEWHKDLDRDRQRILTEAARLAHPKLNGRTVKALGRTIFRFLWFSLAGAVGALLARVRGKDPGPAAVRRANELVRAGGPVYVKLGQFIATAKGALPDEWIDAFAWCRDEVPPLPPGTAQQAITAAFGKSTSQLFESFGPSPVAAASIAQVHAATLPDGTDVMVKVQRPGLRERFEADIRAMSLMAAVVDKVSKRSRIANLPGFVELFAQLVLEELDFRLEAMNMIDIGLATEDAKLDYCRVPRPIPDLVSREVLVMEKVPGIRYTDAADHHGELDGERLVRLAIQGVLEHALIYGVFHGDLHAGNVLVDDVGNFSLVDFGIAGRVNPAERAALTRMMIAMVQEDFEGQVKAIAEFGALPPELDLAEAAKEFSERAVVLRELSDRPLDELDFSTLTDQVGDLVRMLAQHRFRLPKELVLFSKNLLYLNGLAMAVAPKVNLMAEMEPVFLYFLTKYPQHMGSIAMEILQKGGGPLGLLTAPTAATTT